MVEENEINQGSFNFRNLVLKLDQWICFYMATLLDYTTELLSKSRFITSILYSLPLVPIIFLYVDAERICLCENVTYLSNLIFYISLDIVLIITLIRLLCLTKNLKYLIWFNRFVNFLGLVYASFIVYLYYEKVFTQKINTLALLTLSFMFELIHNDKIFFLKNEIFLYVLIITSLILYILTCPSIYYVIIWSISVLFSIKLNYFLFIKNQKKIINNDLFLCFLAIWSVYFFFTDEKLRETVVNYKIFNK